MTIAMFILVIVPALLFYKNYMEKITAMEIHTGKGVYSQVLNTLERRSQIMGMLSIAVANMPRVQEYMYLEDRGYLLKIMLPLFEKLKKGSVISG